MIFKQFRLFCVVRVLFISGTVLLFTYLLSSTSYYAVYVFVGCLIVYQIYALIHYVEKTNRYVQRFLDAIRYDDFSQSFGNMKSGSSFYELRIAFQEVLNKFKKTRAEKEEQYRYLQTVIQHIGIGLLSFQSNGEIELINNAVKRLLNKPQLKNIKTLESWSPELVDTFFKIKTGEKAIVKVEDHSEVLQLMVYATTFIIGGRECKLISIQNIQSELEEKEMEAWQNLIRVLTHEIMNSITPIASMSATVNDMLTKLSAEEKGKEKIQFESIDDIHSAVQTIQKRSQGLLHFVNAYRELTRIPKPDFQIFPISNLFDRVEQLINTQIKNKHIDFNVDVEPETLECTADPELIEQVLINLLLNAIYAVENRPGARIDLSAQNDESGRIIIRVADNGPGIVEEVQEKIFIPFFTTKKKGSGIGLSLSRQIMRLHRGSISVHSDPNVKTVFTLRF
ncbi:GHKL domain-containing protein [bacterium]|nr:GHKL domain-containing protein [bacterium]RQV94742.1 MAG: ATP-binding protein [bacterium]